MSSSIAPGRWRAMLFDLDGTLADTAPDLAAAANAMRVDRGLVAMPLDPLRSVASQGARGLLRVAFDLEPQAADYETMKDEFLARYEADLAVHTRLFDGMAEVLDALETRGLAWGIVTNKASRFTTPLMRHLALTDRAGSIVSGDTTPFTKPHPAPLLRAAEDIDLPPSECVYVGDDHRDILGGQAAGMDTIAAAWGYCATPAAAWGAGLVVASPRDLLALF